MAASWAQAIPGLVGDVDEPAVARIPQNHATGEVARGIIPQFHVIVDMAARDEQVAVSVVVKVHQTAAPFDGGEAAFARAGLSRHVGEHLATQVPI